MNTVYITFTASPIGVNKQVLTAYRNIIQESQCIVSIDHIRSGQAIGSVVTEPRQIERSQDDEMETGKENKQM